MNLVPLSGRWPPPSISTVLVGGQLVLVVDDVVLAATDATYEATFTVP